MGSRRKGRELALQALYQREIAGELSSAELEAFLRHFDGGEQANAFALELVRGVLQHGAEIDRLIAQCCEHWRLERLSKVDRNILRLATYELLERPDVPVSVVINEAVEIARRYGTEDSSPFVNGVLDAIAERCGAKARASTSGENGRAIPTRED